jgi:hypothetical protein
VQLAKNGAFLAISEEALSEFKRVAQIGNKCWLKTKKVCGLAEKMITPFLVVALLTILSRSQIQLMEQPFLCTVQMDILHICEVNARSATHKCIKSMFHRLLIMLK